MIYLMGQEEVKFNFFKFLVLKKPTTNSLLPKFTNDNYISSMYSTHRDRLKNVLSSDLLVLINNYYKWYFNIIYSFQIKKFIIENFYF